MLSYFTSVFVSLGVFLFGYDQGVMSGIITFVTLIVASGSLLTGQQWPAFQGLFQSTNTSRNRYCCCNLGDWGFHILYTHRQDWRSNRSPQNYSLWVDRFSRRRRFSNVCDRASYDDGRSYSCRFGCGGFVHNCPRIPV